MHCVKMDLITETSLEALLQRATDNRNKRTDTAAIDAFCGIIKKEREGPMIASKLIASKIQSTEEWEALQGLTVLECCMKNCGSAFHSEIGKFKFLNEMIKLVSPKFLGFQTPSSVKSKIIRLMHDWSLNYPKEHKIKEAYEMLINQGLSEKNDLPKGDLRSFLPQKTIKEPIVIQNEEKIKLLQKLLHSKNPNDLQAANKLIKTMVMEDERRMELISKRLSEMEQIGNNVKLLSEMLESYVPNHSSFEELELINELHQSCEKFKQNVINFASEMQDNDELLSQILSVGDNLDQVLKKYKNIFVEDKNTQDNLSNISNLSNAVALLDLSVPTEKAVTPITGNGFHLNNSLDLVNPLMHFYENSNVKCSENHCTSNSLETLFSPLTIQNNAGPSLSQNLSKDGKIVEKSEKSKKLNALDELDILGRSMLQQFECNRSSKQSSEDLRPFSNSCHCESLQPTYNNDKLLMDDLNKKYETNSIINKPLNSSNKETVLLKDIFVSLDSIKPSSIPPISVIEEKNGMSVVIYVAKDSPIEDVNVFVVTTVSKNPYPVSDFTFQAVVPKECKLKLQPQSGSELPAHHPFLPPSAITQIMLISNPKKVKMTFKCIISYTMEKETHTEMGEVEELIPVM